MSTTRLRLEKTLIENKVKLPLRLRVPRNRDDIVEHHLPATLEFDLETIEAELCEQGVHELSVPAIVGFEAPIESVTLLASWKKLNSMKPASASAIQLLQSQADRAITIIQLRLDYVGVEVLIVVQPQIFSLLPRKINNASTTKKRLDHNLVR